MAMYIDGNAKASDPVVVYGSKRELELTREVEALKAAREGLEESRDSAYARGYNAAKADAVMMIEECREEGETDLRSVRSGVYSLSPTDGFTPRANR
jgi:hypothetical protein